MPSCARATGAVFGGAQLRDLVTIAASFDEFNGRVVTQHLLLARILQTTFVLQLRAIRPSTLFTAHHRAMLFAPFTGELPESHVVSPEPWVDGRVYEDPMQAAAAASAAEVQSARRQFMLRVVDEVVRLDSWEAEKASSGDNGDVVGSSGGGGGRGGDGGGERSAGGGRVDGMGKTEATLGGVYGLAGALGLGSDDAVLRQHVRLPSLSLSLSLARACFNPLQTVIHMTTHLHVAITWTQSRLLAD